MAEFDRTARAAGTPGVTSSGRANPPTAQDIMEASRQRVAEQIMREARQVNLDVLTQEEALALAAGISTKLRTLGRSRLTPEDNRFLGDLMAKLLAPRS
jgi:hypothetical protein